MWLMVGVFWTSLPALFIQKNGISWSKFIVLWSSTLYFSLKQKTKKKKVFVTAPLFTLPSIGVGLLKITDKMICAGVEGEPLSGCHGDSGGPYVCQSSSGNWFLQGAVSWGSPRCAASERYTVFARVAQFRNWIRQHTGVWEVHEATSIISFRNTEK